MDLKDLEEKLKNIEVELKSIDFRIKNIEATNNVALPDIQTGLVNLTVALGTFRDILIESKITTPEKMQAISEKISKEISDNYEKWMSENKKETPNVRTDNNTSAN